jgi:hypothetical protein
MRLAFFLSFFVRSLFLSFCLSFFLFVLFSVPSDDYESTSNWDIGGSSVLFWAMGMRPSKDNFWSSDGQKRQMGFSQVQGVRCKVQI